MVRLESYITGSYSSITNFVPSLVPDGGTLAYNDMVITREGDVFHVSDLPYVHGYNKMTISLKAVSRDYWWDGDVSVDVPLTTGLTSSPLSSAAPVSITVDGLEPLEGE